MTGETFRLLETYMRTCMQDSAHDTEHIYRVLSNALEIAKTEPEVDYDILIAACLLHDIGRPEQFADPSLCHAAVGAEKARQFLLKQCFAPAFADAVHHCIAAHRFRKNLPPETTEARILFDADKLDVTGALGVARTLEYQGALALPLYTLLPDGSVSDGTADSNETFFQEYCRKLDPIYDRFLTARGRAMAGARREAAAAFYDALLREVRSSRDLSVLDRILKP